VNEVRAGELRFQREEATSYLQEALGEALPEDDVISLLERTEGWIAGLHLAALSLRGRADMKERIQEFAGTDRYVADYLMEELLCRLEPPVQRYLMATSVLERLYAPLCLAVQGDESIETIDGRPVLEWLEDSNFFVFSLDEQRLWFRYHNLFRDLLRHWLISRWPADEVEGLHLRAGCWLGEEHLVDEALGHFHQAQRLDLAAELVEQHRAEAVNQERWRELARWVRHVGPLVDDRPRLVSIHAWLAHERTDWADMRRHSDRVERLLDCEQEPSRDNDSLRGEVAMMRAQLSYQLGQGEEAVAQARRALTLLPPEHRLVRASAVVFEGAGLHLLGRNDEAHEVFRRAAFGDYGTGIHPRVMVGLASLGIVRGELDEAAKVGNFLLSQATDQGLDESAGWAHYFLGLAAYLRNDLAGAEGHYQAIEPYAAHAVPGKHAFYGLAWVRLAQARPDEALDIMARCLAFTSDLDLPFSAEARLLRGRLRALAGRQAEEMELARGLLPIGEGPLSLQVYYESSLLSAIALLLLAGNEDDLGACEAGLRRLLAAAQSTGNVFREVQILVLQALLLDRQEHRPEALEALDRAVALAKPGRLLRLFPEMGDRVGSLLQSLRVRKPGDHLLEELSSLFGGPEALPAASARFTEPAGDEFLIETLLTNRELDVLELLEQRLSNKEIAQRLVISPATVKRHTLNIYAKLGVSSRREAAARARQLRLLQPGRGR
jgi:LuxR family maltose regulon positive regulatory protein